MHVEQQWHLARARREQDPRIELGAVVVDREVLKVDKSRGGPEIGVEFGERALDAVFPPHEFAWICRSH